MVSDTSEKSVNDMLMQAVKDWTSQLVDVTGRNTLLSFKDLKVGTLDLTGIGDSSVDLLSGRSIRFSTTFKSEDLAGAARRGRAIQARSDENYEERGLRTLFVAWGMATWVNNKSTFTPRAPVLLCQAQLTARGSAADDFELVLTGDWEINPTLLHVLASDFDVRVSSETLLDLLDVDSEPLEALALFDHLTREAGRIEGFDIKNSLALANFSYAKLPMVNDLVVGLDLLAQNTLIQAIAGDETARQDLRDAHPEVSETAPDSTPPSDEYLVLDADSSQSYVINSVVGGANLVIEGPPGTGKSQTIANLIATLSARGERVLFVAEKRAAIDAVLSRLEKVGLGDLVLDLHDGPGAKGKLAQQFANALAAAATARPTSMEVAQEQMVRRRDVLVRRTEALHLTRAPWGLSPFQLQTALTKVPESVKTDLRLQAGALKSLTGEAFRKAEANLEQFVGLGGLKLEATASPWLPAIHSGSIATPEQAGAVLEAMTTFTQHTLPQATERIDKALSSVGLTRPDSVADWSRTLDLLNRVAEQLENFESSVFALDLDALLLAMEPATSGPVGRAWNGLFNGAYRAAVRSLEACSKGSSINATELHAALVNITQLVADWQVVCTDGALPRLPSDLAGAEGTYEQLLGDLRHLERALGQEELEELSPDQLAGRVRTFIEDRKTLFKVPELHRLESDLKNAGLTAFLTELRNRNLSVDQALACLRFVWHSSVLDAISISDSEVGAFDGESFSRMVSEFRESDRQHIASAPVRIRRSVAENVIAVRNAFPAESQLVAHEAGKKRRHLPMRTLLQQAPHVLTALKPCWAMSPLVVSQVLPAQQLFDVVIFDEASQVTPESAVGSLMRAGRAVVAGDPHQLPPTAFFASGSPADNDDDAGDEVETSMTRDFESILDQMKALLPPPIGTKRLNWHYRSRDERLIAFSNAQPNLYNWSLTTFPGARSDEVISHELAPFVSGRVGQEESSADEVAMVVGRVVAHAHARPNESLGVITMGIKHMERINEGLRRARQEDPVLDQYLDHVFFGTEKFFVKNLERVQGDERDAILISIGYTKSADGRMLYRFGPLNNKGGERRLNVAITRARSRLGVVSSFSSADLDPARLKSDGAKMLRAFLIYVESGGTDLGEQQRERDPLNAFEQDVLEQLSAAGLNLECQVGCSGYWIDFAAKHPTEPGRYVLAIEADGARYHSAWTARDRDRLRQDHLERLGWTFHRIWSTDWFHHREREVARVMTAFESALSEGQGAVTVPDQPAEIEPASEVVHLRSGSCPINTARSSIAEYQHRELVALMRWIGSDGLLRTKDELIGVAMIELGFKRSGSRILAALGRAADDALGG